MRTTSRSAFNSVLFAAIALGLLTTPVVIGRQGSPPASTRASVITSTVGPFRSVPKVTSTRRRIAISEIGTTLRSMYTRAFVPTAADERASPRPSAARKLRSFMTSPATAALKASEGVFDIHGLVLASGSVTFSGLVTFGSKHPIDALLEIEFEGRATPAARASPFVDVHQLGRIELKRTSLGWLVDGFDLELKTRPAPTPTPR